MSTLNIYWNLIRNSDTQIDLRSLTNQRDVIVSNPQVPPQCRGIYFRSVLSVQPNINAFLEEVTLNDVRKARQEPDTTLLFRPKKTIDKSIGVLRIIRPLRFNETPIEATIETPEGAFANVTFDEFRQRNLEFEVLLESTEFILEDVQEQMAERFQLQETFGDFNVFFFGKRAEIFTYSGSLLNGDGNLNWRNKFLRDYEENLRGTKAAEKKARAYMLYDDVIREGYILSAGLGQNSLVDGVVKFNFTMLVTNRRILGFTPPTRTGIINLAARGQEGQGITEFRFIRSLDPAFGGNLPQVTADPEVIARPNVIVVSLRQQPPPPINFPFVQDKSIPGSQPPDDTKQLMISRSLKAIDQIRGSGKLVGSGASVDHDVLLEFIRDTNLGSTTKLIMSGKRTLDVENFKGDELVLLLLDNALSLDDISLKQAVDVAVSLATTNSARVGDANILGKLAVFAAYFKSDSFDPEVRRNLEQTAATLRHPRLSGTQGQPSIPLPPETNFRKILNLNQTDGKTDAGQTHKYVLSQSLDGRPIGTLLDDFKVLRSPAFDGTFVIGDLDEKVVNSVPIGIAIPITASGSSKSPIQDQLAIVRSYAAVFALVKNPATSGFFKAVSDRLVDIENLGGKADAVEFIDQMPISEFKEMLEELTDDSPGNPSSTLNALKNAMSDFKSTSLMQTIATRTGLVVDNIPFTEATLAVAKGTFTAGNISSPGLGPTFLGVASGDYISQTSIYLGGVIRDLFVGSLKNVDHLGGTARLEPQLPGQEASQFDSYFKKDYAASITPLANGDEKELKAEVMGYAFATRTEVLARFGKDTGDGSKHLILPLCHMGEFFSMAGTFFYGPGQPEDQALAHAGFPRVPASIVQTITNSSRADGPVLLFGGIRRKQTNPGRFKGLRPITGPDFGVGRGQTFFFAGRTFTEVFGIERFPVQRTYLGRAQSQAKTIIEATPFGVELTHLTVNTKVRQDLPEVIDAVTEATKGFISTGLPTDPNVRGIIKNALTLEPLLKDDDIKAVNEAVVLSGIKVDNYIDLGTVAKVQNEMANNMYLLHDTIKDALAEASKDPENRGGQVDSNDKELQNTLCGDE